MSIICLETEDISIPKGKSSQTTIKTNQPGIIHSCLNFPICSRRNYRSTSSRWVCSGQKRRIFQFPKEIRHKLLSERISHAIFFRISIFPFSEEETTAAPVPGGYFLARNRGYFNSQTKVVTNYHQNGPARQYSFVSLFPFSSGRNYRSTSWWVFSGQKQRIFQFQRESRHKIPLEQINEEIFIRISNSLY